MHTWIDIKKAITKDLNYNKARDKRHRSLYQNYIYIYLYNLDTGRK